jgi:hypothetical protein
MDASNIVDGIVIVNDRNPEESVIFNFHTWVSIIKAIIVRYSEKNEYEAEKIIMDSWLVKRALEDYMAIVVRAHELDYHWAMILVHGERYWRRGISEIEPDNFWEWEEEYKRDHNLKQESFIFRHPPKAPPVTQHI